MSSSYFSYEAAARYSPAYLSSQYARFATIDYPDRSDSDFSLYEDTVNAADAAHPPASPIATSPITAAPPPTSAHPPPTPISTGLLNLPLLACSSFHSFQNALADSFQVRCGPNYSKNGKKQPSADSLYTLSHVQHIQHKSSRVVNPGRYYNLPLPSSALSDSTSLNIPLHLVFNFQLPSKASLFSSSPDDTGHSLVLVFTLKPRPSPLLPALKLLQRFQADKLRYRFKVIGFVDNLASLGVPSLVASFNGKPFIVEKTGQVFREPTYIGVDIDVHQFPVLARKTLVSMKDSLAKAKLRVGFVLQGESDDELPEQLLGAALVDGVPAEATTLDLPPA